MEELEQPNESQETNLGSKQEFGKFKDAESLLKAYNSLQAEFTKKSQRLADLETQNETALKQQNRQAEIDKKVEEFVAKFDIVKPFSSALKETLTNTENANLAEESVKMIAKNYKRAEDYANDSEFLNNYIFSNTEIKDKIIKDYLGKITQTSPIKMEGNGNILLSKPSVPTTIAEAGKLAKTIIKQK